MLYLATEAPGSVQKLPNFIGTPPSLLRTLRLPGDGKVSSVWAVRVTCHDSKERPIEGTGTSGRS